MIELGKVGIVLAFDLVNVLMGIKAVKRCADGGGGNVGAVVKYPRVVCQQIGVDEPFFDCSLPSLQPIHMARSDL